MKKLYFAAALSTLALFIPHLTCARTQRWTDYPIQAGNHYSDGGGVVNGALHWIGGGPLNIPAQEAQSLQFSFKFGSNASYISQAPVNQNAINKLWGSSDCGRSDPTRDSVRVGWHWDPNLQKIELVAYVDFLNQHEYQHLAYVDLEKEYSAKIALENGDTSHFVFTLDSERVVMTRHCNHHGIHGYELFPYFGGVEVAPHRIDISLKRE